MRVFAVLFGLVVLFVASPARAESPQCEAAACGPPATTHMRSVPLFITGVFFDVLGGAATAGGVGLLVAGSSCPDTEGGRTSVGCGIGAILLDIAGVAALVGGGVLLAIGIPLTVVGATSVPDKAATAPSRVRLGSGGGLTLTF